MSAQLKLLVFTLNDRLYGLNCSQVHRVIRAVDAPALPGAPDTVMGAIDLQGEIVPLLNIRRRFALPDRPVGIEDHFVIASTSRRLIALAVDRVAQIVERNADQIVSPGQIHDGLQLLSGVVSLDEGLLYIHDLDKFLSPDQEHALDQALATQEIHANCPA